MTTPNARTSSATAAAVLEPDEFYAIDNEVHHRGQGYVYLRALNVEPPPFYER